MAVEHRLSADIVHYAWDNEIPPRLIIDSGDIVAFETRDAADYFYNEDSTHAEILRKGPLKGHPLTGPIFVRDALPGDTLALEILDVAPRFSFGWTAIRPGRGLLPDAEFPDPFLQIWDISDNDVARMRQRDDIAVPIESFPGIAGTALAAPGEHSTIPPRANGGNLDIRHLVKGSTLYLPVSVPGALLSVGDAHAAQGDGEVCVTAIEMSAHVTLRISLTKRTIAEPQLHIKGGLCGRLGQSSFFATTSHGPDLYACAQRATRYMIEHLVAERGLSREEAYVLCSVCADLKITQIVDAPHWSVSAFLPEAVFV